MNAIFRYLKQIISIAKQEIVCTYRINNRGDCYLDVVGISISD